MKKIKVINNEEVTEDIFCDICGKSCLVYKDKIDNPEHEKYGEYTREFSYLSMSNHWGYFSGKDWETWSAQICESCVDKHLDPLICFEKEDELSGKDITDKDWRKRILREGRLNKILKDD